MWSIFPIFCEHLVIVNIQISWKFEAKRLQYKKVRVEVVFFRKLLHATVCRPISCWLSSLAVEYHLLWTIISYVVWYSSPADDIQLKQIILIWRTWYSTRADDIQLKQMILIWRGQFSSRADDIHSMETIFIQDRRISTMRINSWN
jgi:hypothetical protein